MKIHYLCIALLATTLQSAFAATNDTAVARSRLVADELQAYAQVVPVSQLPIRAAVTGVVANVHVLPGEQVTAGELLGKLGGPDAAAYLAQRQAAVHSARAELQDARETLAITRQTSSERLGTRLNVYNAKAKFEQAKAALEAARAAQAAAKAAVRLTAPTGGKVRTVNVANGERVAGGRTLITLQPAGGLWLKATFYGKDIEAIHPGMKGRFVPADGSGAIPVHVRSVIGRLRPGGGESVGLIANAGGPSWRSGEAGMLMLKGSKARTMVTVPTRALILARGDWWVLVSEGGHDQARRVVPSVHEGKMTAIAQGLQAGEHVVVSNAYLRFHRSVADQYQPPD